MAATLKSTILVVDDDDALRNMICRALSVSYDVHEAADAKIAFERLATMPVPDAIVCDVMMPVQNGFDFVKQVRAMDKFKRVPIVFLTARTSAMDVIEGINSGARAYMTKPFKIAALVEKIGKIVG